MRTLPLLLLLLACTPATDDDAGDNTEAGPIVDPDVHSWFPDDFPPESPDRIIYLGDSITAGYGLGDKANGYTRLLVENNDEKWPTWADRGLRERWPDLEARNFSIPGATTRSVIAEQLPDVEEALGPVVSGDTVVVITIGGNDALDAVTGSNLEEDVAGIIDRIGEIAEWFLDPARFPDGVHLAMTNVYEPSDGVGQTDACFYGIDLSASIQVFEGANQSTLALAKDQGWAWIDLRGHFLGHGFHHDDDDLDVYDAADPTLWFQDDCIHPNPRGHHELRRLVLAAIDGVALPLEGAP